MRLNTLRDRQGPVAWRVEASEIRPTRKRRVFQRSVSTRDPWERHGKTMGKPWENQGKTHGKPMENIDVWIHGIICWMIMYIISNDNQWDIMWYPWENHWRYDHKYPKITFLWFQWCSLPDTLVYPQMRIHFGDGIIKTTPNYHMTMGELIRPQIRWFPRTGDQSLGGGCGLSQKAGA